MTIKIVTTRKRAKEEGKCDEIVVAITDDGEGVDPQRLLYDNRNVRS